MKYGLTRMPYSLEPTLEAISPVIHAAAHFYWHRRRTLQTGRGLATKVEIEVMELEDGMETGAVYGPTARVNWKGGNCFNLQTETAYRWRIFNKSNVALYPALFYFDNSDWSISEHRHM